MKIIHVYLHDGYPQIETEAQFREVQRKIDDIMAKIERIKAEHPELPDSSSKFGLSGLWAEKHRLWESTKQVRANGFAKMIGEGLRNLKSWPTRIG